MNNFNLPKFAKSMKMSLTQHSPEILTGIGIAGMVTTTVLAVSATPKALKLIEEKKQETKTDKLTPIETVKTCWKPYIPAMITCGVSIACLIGASKVNLKRNAALATAYTLSERALTEYKDKVVKTVGEETAQKIKEEIDKDKVEKNPVSKNEVIITGKGDILCLDSISGRYFKSSQDIIDKAINRLNRQVLTEMYISLNEFYDELELDHISAGYDLGWNIDSGIIEAEYGSQIADDGTPCIVLNYSVEPKYGYSKFL